MTDMAYLTHDECLTLGFEPYAVYGAQVYSFHDGNGQTVVHGTLRYERALNQLRSLAAQERP